MKINKNTEKSWARVHKTTDHSNRENNKKRVKNVRMSALCSDIDCGSEFSVSNRYKNVA